MGPLIFYNFFEKGIDKRRFIVYNNIVSKQRRKNNEELQELYCGYNRAAWECA